MTKLHPDSTLALSQASLWRHMRRVWRDLCSQIEEQTVETIKNMCILLFLFSLILLWPVSVPIVAWLRRARDRKFVRQWDKKTK